MYYKPESFTKTKLTRTKEKAYSKKNRGNIKHTWVVNTIVTGENLNDLIRSTLKQIYAFCGHSKLFHI